MPSGTFVKEGGSTFSVPPRFGGHARFLAPAVERQTRSFAEARRLQRKQVPNPTTGLSRLMTSHMVPTHPCDLDTLLSVCLSLCWECSSPTRPGGSFWILPGSDGTFSKGTRLTSPVMLCLSIPHPAYFLLARLTLTVLFARSSPSPLSSLGGEPPERKVSVSPVHSGLGGECLVQRSVRRHR